jgi:hypothetical protein
MRYGKRTSRISIICVSVLLALSASIWYKNYLDLDTLLFHQAFTTTATPINNDSIYPSSSGDESLSTQHQLQRIGITPLLQPDEDDPWIQTLYDRLDRIRLKCGNLCSINDVTTLQHFSTNDSSSIIIPDVDCPSILGLEEIDAGDQTFPPFPPDELIPFYTLSGSISLHKFKNFKQVYLGKEALQNIWTKEEIDTQIQEAILGNQSGSYGPEIATYVRDGLKPMQHKIINASILVIGSERPWVEAIVLSLGASKVTTLEYGTIHSQHEKITTETPASIRHKYLNGTLPLFDGVVSYSSLEHSGLGRYGDALNPWGDILAVARAWCLTKDNGLLYLGLPTFNGTDSVEWNAHRIYGKLRWPLVTANWKPIGENPPWIGYRQSGIGNLFVKMTPS